MLAIAERQPKGKNTRPGTIIWQSLPDNEVLDTVNQPCQRIPKCQTNPTKKDRLPQAYTRLNRMDPYWWGVSDTVGKPGSVYPYNENGVLIIQAERESALQRFVPTSFLAPILHSAHYPVFAGHSGERQLYDTLLRNYCCPHMGNDAYINAAACPTGAGQCPRTHHQKQLRLIPAAGPQEFLAMGTLSALLKT